MVPPEHAHISLHASLIMYGTKLLISDACMGDGLWAQIWHYCEHGSPWNEQSEINAHTHGSSPATEHRSSTFHPTDRRTCAKRRAFEVRILRGSGYDTPAGSGAPWRRRSVRRWREGRPRTVSDTAGLRREVINISLQCLLYAINIDKHWKFTTINWPIFQWEATCCCIECWAAYS